MALRQVAHTILHELAPREVYRAPSVAFGAVSSYLTFSPLLRYQSERFVFCCTVCLANVAINDPLLRSKDRRARYLLVSGLSSPSPKK